MTGIERAGKMSGKSVRMSARAVAAHRLNPRNWCVVSVVLLLHLRHLRFHPRLLDQLHRGELPAVLDVDDKQLSLVRAWNRRIGDLFGAAGLPYARCMKRCLVMARLLGKRRNVEIVIGVLPGRPLEGHAWLLADGEIVEGLFDPVALPYVVVRRLSVAIKEK